MANAVRHNTEVEVDLARDGRSVVVQVKSQNRRLLYAIRDKLGYFRYGNSGCLVFCINLVDMLMNLYQVPPESALEEVKRRAADKVIEVIEDVAKASSPTPVLVKVGNFSPLLLSAEGLMEEPLPVMSTIRREVLYLLIRVKLDNLLVSSFRG